MESHLRHLHSFQQQQQVVVDPSNTAGDGRFPQWSLQETKEFLGIRAELDQSFMETKRNKLLWEVISTRMKDKGFNRSPEQCKCKWKNLVTRYKGCETMEPEAMRQQFPFYNELQAIFAARMQRMLWSEAEGGKKKLVGLSSDEELDQENDIESEGLDHPHHHHHKASAAAAAAGSSNKKLKRPISSSSSGKGGGGNGAAAEVKEMLDEFMRQQMQIEIQWREAAEARESERRMKEMEWRQKMEALENERVMMERRWREREEQRRMREEARAEKRDALITALLNTIRTTSSVSSSRDQYQDPHHHHNLNHI